MSRYRVGDWIKDTVTGDVYEIIDRVAGVHFDWYKLEQKIDGFSGEVVNHGYKISCTLDSLRAYYIDASVARLLYSNSIKKAVQNETNEK